MSDRNRVALALVAAALLLGIAGDVLFQVQPLGLNACLWAALCTLALAVLLRVARAALHQGRRLMVAPVLVFAGLFAWHDSPVLVAANLLALAAAVATSVDLRYLAGLGDDAVPTVVARLGTLPPAERRELAFDLLDRGTATHGWRSWNLARSRAAGTLRAHRAQLP